MNDLQIIQLSILLVEDDEENLELLIESLPDQRQSCNLMWHPCQDFDEAVQYLEERRFDLVVTDIYRNRTEKGKGIDPEDEWAKKILDSIRQKRFCPIIVFTDGPAPQTFEKEQPFVKYADKSVGNTQILERLDELLATGVPQLARALHDELDSTAGSYLWDFLNQYWFELDKQGLSTPQIIERLVRRRASIQLSRLIRSNDNQDQFEEIGTVEGLEFYLYPSVSQRELRLGEIIKDKKTQEIRVILTPHCHLAIQPDQDEPRADYVLTVKTVPVGEVLAANPLSGNERRQRTSLRQYIQSPARVGRPDGRYWFLPGFLQIPEVYCDFLQLESIEYQDINKNFDLVAVLDTPFAEALQSCFTRFYSAVGLPGLKPDRYEHWIRND